VSWLTFDLANPWNCKTKAMFAHLEPVHGGTHVPRPDDQLPSDDAPVADERGKFEEEHARQMAN
jgi:hypothetical protein